MPPGVKPSGWLLLVGGLQGGYSACMAEPGRQAVKELRMLWLPPSGVEQTKQCKEEPKEEKVVKPESVLIKRRLSVQGQAISVVGSLSTMSPLEEEVPQAKRRPEPIIPVTQPR